MSTNILSVWILATAPAIAIFASDSIPAESHIKLAFSYGGFAVMALAMWFLLRDQAVSFREMTKEQTNGFKEQIAALSSQYLEASKSERKDHVESISSLRLNVVEDHKVCRADHMNLGGKIDIIMERLGRVVDYIYDHDQDDAK